MNKFKANQKLLFKAETVFNLRPLEKYEILFSFLDTSPLEILFLLPADHLFPMKLYLKHLFTRILKMYLIFLIW
ncbi:MAG: hypothetical protein ABIK21_04690 [bacterium]